MTITINAQGVERKRLVTTISNWLGIDAHYCGAPTFAYEIDYFTVDKNGSLSFDDRADSEVIERLLEHLYNEGFDIDMSAGDSSDDEEVHGIYIRTDPAGNIKPDKEKSTEKIDGAVATIMALDRAIRCGNDTSASVYDERGLLFL